MPSKLKEITDNNFQSEVVEDKGIVLVDYYAEWCAPCKAIGATIEELNEEYSDKLKIVKGDISKNGHTVSKFGITGIPAILMFKEGGLINKHIGLRSKKDLKRDIEEVING